MARIWPAALLIIVGFGGSLIVFLSGFETVFWASVPTGVGEQRGVSSREIIAEIVRRKRDLEVEKHLILNQITRVREGILSNDLLFEEESIDARLMNLGVRFSGFLSVSELLRGLKKHKVSLEETHERFKQLCGASTSLTMIHYGITVDDYESLVRSLYRLGEAQSLEPTTQLGNIARSVRKQAFVELGLDSEELPLHRNKRKAIGVSRDFEVMVNRKALEIFEKASHQVVGYLDNAIIHLEPLAEQEAHLVKSFNRVLNGKLIELPTQRNRSRSEPSVQFEILP